MFWGPRKRSQDHSKTFLRPTESIFAFSGNLEKALKSPKTISRPLQINFEAHREDFHNFWKPRKCSEVPENDLQTTPNQLLGPQRVFLPFSEILKMLWGPWNGQWTMSLWGSPLNLVRGAILKSLISYPNVCIQYVLYGSLIVDEKGGRDLASLADWGHVPMT